MVKFVGGFHSTLEFGHVIIISGHIKENAENFTLNLLGNYNAHDIPFHMNVVFGERSQIIRNTKIHGEFGAAENAPGMFTREPNPLRPGDVLSRCAMCR
jgi:Galactoside-binding lectin